MEADLEAALAKANDEIAARDAQIEHGEDMYTNMRNRAEKAEAKYIELAERDNSLMDAALRERTEVCAKLCDENHLISGSIGPLMNHGWALCQKACAAVIRALLKEELMMSTDISVAVESAVHKALREFAQRIFDEHGIALMDARFEWADVSLVGGKTQMLLTSVEAHTKTRE